MSAWRPGRGREGRGLLPCVISAGGGEGRGEVILVISISPAMTRAKYREMRPVESCCKIYELLSLALNHK